MTKERFRSSFYHRLDPTTELDSDGYCDLMNLQEQVVRDLEVMLHSQYGQTRAKISFLDYMKECDADTLRGTNLRYGINAQVLQDPMQDNGAKVLRYELQRAIELFEPRLTKVDVKKEELTRRGSTLSFAVTAQLLAIDRDYARHDSTFSCRTELVSLAVETHAKTDN